MNSILASIIGVAGGAILGAVTTYLRSVAKITGRVKDLEKWRCYAQEDTNNQAKESEILLRSVLACLYGLKEQGCNGPVSHGIETLEQFLDNGAHRPISYTKPTERI